MKKSKYFGRIRLVCLVIAIGLAMILIFFQTNKITKYYENILFILDVSNSMNVRDIVTSDEGLVTSIGDVAQKRISRLDAAKYVITEIVNSQKDVNRGAAVFSQISNRFVPMTNDTGTFFDYLDSVNTNILPGGGTDISSIDKLFSGNDLNYSKIIIISDANLDNESISALAGWKNIKLDANVYYIGIGTKDGEWVRYANGNIVRDKGIKVIGKYNPEYAKLISQRLNAKLIEINRLDLRSASRFKSDRFIDEIINSTVNFSYNEVQILFVLLGVFIVLVL